MFKQSALAILFLLFFAGHAQEVSLPADMRQHTLNQYNASLFNPAFSLDRNNPQSVSFWTRWQWQNVDTDPTTLFLNYSRNLNENSAAAVGFFQHNTGIYFNTGGSLNYAHQFEFNRLIKLTVGANVFGFVQELADTRFPITPIPGIPQSIPTNDFILQIAPGFNLQVENFSMSLASENLIDYNFTDKESNTATSDKIFMGMASYDFPVIASDSTAYIRPSIYLRTIPEQQNQIGLNALFSTQKFWIQSGYNNFYGISVGAGGTVFNRFSLGALVEFGTNSSLNSKDPSFEIIASYFLGRPEERRPLVASGVLDENQEVTLFTDEIDNDKIREELEKAEQLSNQGKEDVKQEREAVKPDEELITSEEVKVAESIGEQMTKEEKKEAKRLASEEKALKKQERKDSIAAVKREKAALVVLKQQEEEQVIKEAEASRKEELLAAAEKLKEEQRLDKLKNEQEEAESVAQRKLDAIQIANKASADAERRLKEQQRLEKLKNDKEAAAQLVEQQKLDSIQDANKAIAAELKLKERQGLEALEKEKEVKAIAEAQRERQQRVLDSIQEAKKDEAIATALKREEKIRLDSIAKTKALEEVLALEEAEQENDVKEEPEVVKIQAGEKYEEVVTEGELEPGFYLIANVFGTKKYFDAFMRDLTNKGIQPKSFYRSQNKFNYAYLERYETISEARRARDSKFNGKYNAKTWIFRVRGK